MAGEFDMAAEAVVAAPLAELLEAPSPRLVVLDMGEVTFLDSTGVRLLLHVYQRIVQHGGGRLRIVGIPDMPRRVLDLCGVLKLDGIEEGPALTVVRSGANGVGVHVPPQGWMGLSADWLGEKPRDPSTDKLKCPTDSAVVR